MRKLFLLLMLAMSSAVFAQNPPIEPGVPQQLARWRAAHYSDVRYKLNLTLEKMSPVLKGTIEIRVNVRGAESKSSPPYEGGVDAALGGRGGSPIILDWRKIRGFEERSTISNVSINGSAASFARDEKNHPVGETPTPLLRKEGSQNGPPIYSEQNEHLIFRGGVVAGENVIKLDFTSPILTSGSAITRYVDKEDGSEYIYSLFVPSDASTAFPVFDQPDLKARFTVEVTYPTRWRFITNTLASSASPNCDQVPGQPPLSACKATFHESLPISTYVFAFAAGPFANVRIGSLPGDTGPPMRIYVRKSQFDKFGEHGSEVGRLTREGINYLEAYFDYKFPWPKYDQVLIPEFPFGGMEHAGATFLREDRVIFPTEPTKNDYITRANVIFHEAAHQWFGDMVTMRWFDDLWLKEGFAEFMAYKTLEKVMPEYNAWKVFYERNKQAAYLTDSTKGTTPIYQEIPNLSAAKSAYGNIVYRKAPSFLKQAEFYIGPDKFQRAVRAFLKKHEFGNAEWTDLVEEFARSRYGDNSMDSYYVSKLQNWARQWVTQRGLPVYRVSDMSSSGVESLCGSALRKCLTMQQRSALGDSSFWDQKIEIYHRNTPGKSGVRLYHELADGQFSSKGEKPIGIITVESETDFVFPNYKDYGYGIFLLDDKSRDYVLKNIQNEKDDFLRTMMWGSLWDSVREGELDPKEYVELVIRNINVESDESTIQTLLGRVSTAMTYYLPENERDGLTPQVESMLIDMIRNAPTTGQRITYYRALLNIASTENARNFLKELLRKSVPGAVATGFPSAANNPVATAPGTDKIPLKTKDRFDIVTRLLILNDPEAPKLLADLEKSETSDEAKRYAYAAKAGIATAENKAKFWDDFVNNKTISESWIEAAFGPFNSVRHADLTLPYLERALKELPNHKRNRKIFFVNGWLAAFIGGQRSEEALNIVNKFLADNPDLDRDLRLKILENVDVIERAVKIRKKFAA